MKKRIIKGSAFVLAVCILLSAFIIALSAIDNLGSTTLYQSELANGKCFVNGENSIVDDINDFDSYITKINVRQNNDYYYITFIYDNQCFSIEAEMVSANLNNSDNQHYLFSPTSSDLGIFVIQNIKFTTNANNFDLLPVNKSLTGACVLTLIVKDQENNLYYWQTEMMPVARSITLLTSEEQQVISDANEYYYMSSEQSDENIEVIDIDIIEDEVSEEVYEQYKGMDTNTNLRATYTDNPYYDLGVPNSSFTTVTNKWQYLSVGKIPGTTEKLPVTYYVYSFNNHGSSEIYTHIMMIGRVVEFPGIDSVVTVEDLNQSYSKASGMLKIEIFRTPHTVIYDPATKLYSFMLGGENLTQIVEPSVEILKNSTGVPHVLSGRYAFSNATKNNLLGVGALVLRDVTVKLLDSKTYGLLSTAYSLVDVAGEWTKSVGTEDDYMPIEEFSPSATYQYYYYDGKIMGSSKSQVKGYLRTYQQYLGTRCWFAVPVENKSSVINLKAVTYTSIEMR